MAKSDSVVHVRRETERGRTARVNFRRDSDGLNFQLSAHVLREIGGNLKRGIRQVVGAVVGISPEQAVAALESGKLTQHIINAASDSNRPTR